jgi:hypothetical protein
MDTKAVPSQDRQAAEFGFDEAAPLDEAMDVVLALAASWSTYGLYPDPGAQPAFLRTVERLRNDLSSPIILAVGPGTVMFGDVDITGGRESVERFAKALFLHDIEFAVVVGNATAEGLIGLFDLLTEEPSIDEHNRVGVASLELDGGGLELYGRGMLELGPRGMDADGAEDAGTSDLTRAAFAGAKPEELAETVMASDADPSDVFVAGVEEVHEQVSPNSRRLTLAQMKGQGEDPWKALRSLVEAFFFLPRPTQLAVLERILEQAPEEQSRVFLDQLSGHDLASFLPDLGSAAAASLLEYAVASAGTTDGQPAELLETLQAARDVQSARIAMAERVSSVLLHPEVEAGKPIEEMLNQLRGELSSFPGANELGQEVLRTLLECEERPDRFRRIVRIWTGRVARSIRTGEFETADRLLNDILEDPPYGIDKEPVVNEGLARMTSPELLRSFVEHQAIDSLDDQSARLLRRLAPRVFDQMIERLAEANDAQERRLLTELLAASLSDVRKLEPYLHDSRWFVVRNLAMVLGKSGKSAAMQPLKQIRDHPESRVRIEVLRSMVRLSKGDTAELLIEAFSDGHERVRHSAVALLKASESSDLDARVGEYLASDGVDAEIGKALVGFLLERATPEAIEVVHTIGSRKFAARGNARAVRDVARAAMKRGGR